MAGICEKCQASSQKAPYYFSYEIERGQAQNKSKSVLVFRSRGAVSAVVVIMGHMRVNLLLLSRNGNVSND